MINKVSEELMKKDLCEKINNLKEGDMDLTTFNDIVMTLVNFIDEPFRDFEKNNENIWKVSNELKSIADSNQCDYVCTKCGNRVDYIFNGDESLEEINEICNDICDCDE